MVILCAKVSWKSSELVFLQPRKVQDCTGPPEGTFTSLQQMTETFQAMDRIVALHPLPFTPANVFFISLGWLDFPHVLPSSSSQFPQGFPQQTCSGVLSEEGLLKYIPDMSLALFISPSPDSWG